MPAHQSHGQSTDAINSAPLVKAAVREDDVRSKSLASVQTLSGENRAETGGEGTDDIVRTAVQAGK
ncbi:hypothetical protein LCGC14_1913280 [marine sediment metagenome]|uniref:SMP domain-containing protein n=1 Tax=marine sediment metagenome TaxID=412755 RepID=A0A0F9I707_9ZZZZ